MRKDKKNQLKQVIADHNNNELNKSTLSTITAGQKIGKVDLLIIGYKCENVVKASSNLAFEIDFFS